MTGDGVFTVVASHNQNASISKAVVRQIAMDGVQLSPRNYYCQPLLDASPCDGAATDLDFQFSPGNRADFPLGADNLNYLIVRVLASQKRKFVALG